jgi:AraC-like DNA-binding protein
MHTLTHWRMQVACNILKSGDKRIADVASSVGYGSESAFSLAFKKVVAAH